MTAQGRKNNPKEIHMRELEKALIAALRNQIDSLALENQVLRAVEAAEIILKLTHALAELRASAEPQWPTASGS